MSSSEEDIASAMENLNVNDNSSFESYEQSYEATRQSGVTQRRFRASAAVFFNSHQRMVEQLTKSRKSLDVSQARQFFEEASQDDKLNHMEQRANDQAEVLDNIIKCQNGWNQNFDVFAHEINDTLDQLTSGVDNLQSSVAALTQSIVQTNAQLDVFIANQQQAKGTIRDRRSSSHFFTEFMEISTNKKEERFRESDIDYFDSTCSEAIHGKGDYVTIGDKVHYRDVWLFIDSVKSIATVKGASLVRINLHRCFRGTAQSWYIVELSKSQRSDLHNGQNLRHWENALTERFKINEVEALMLLHEDKYIVEDVRRQREVFSYVQSVVRHNKEAGIMSVSQQLHWVWSHLDPGLQRDVIRSGRHIIVFDFIQHLEDRQLAWRRYYAREPSKRSWSQAASTPPSSQYQQQSYHQQQSYQQQLYQSINQSYFRGQQYNNRGYNNQRNQFSYSQSPSNSQFGQNRNGSNLQPRYPSNPSPVNQNQRIIEVFFSRQPSWQKTTWNASAAPTASSSASAYHNTAEEEYQEVYHEEEVQNQSEEEVEEQFHSAMAGVYFNDYAMLKYGLASYTCGQNHDIMIFGNSVELRDHVLDYHGVDTRFAGLKYRNREANYIQHAEEHVYNFSSSFFMGYAMIQASLFNVDFTSCLDTGGGVFLCDRGLLSNGNIYGLVHIIKSITITGVAGMQVLDQYIEQDVLLGPNRIPISMKAYLVNNLQFGLIIGMDVLNRGDIDLLLSRQALRVGEIEISLCYSSTMPVNEVPAEDLSINEMSAVSYFISPSGEGFYFYHFNAAHTNSDDVMRQKTRKWKLTSNLLSGLQMLQKSVNHIAKRFFISTAIESHGSILPTFSNLHQMRIIFYFKSANSSTSLSSISMVKLVSNRKHADLKTSGKSLRNRDLASSITSASASHRICRRCKQHFTSGNLLHRHISHCSKGTTGFKSAAKAVRLNNFWRKH